MWSEPRDKTEENKNEQLSILYFEDSGVVKHFEKTRTVWIVYDIKGLYSGESVEEIKNNILHQLLGNNWLAYETHRVSSLLESFSLGKSDMRICDDEEINDLHNPSNVYPNPKKTLAARRSRQKLTDSEKLYIFKTATNDPNWVSEMLWKFNLSYSCLRKIIKEYPKIAAQFELKRWETK